MEGKWAIHSGCANVPQSGSRSACTTEVETKSAGVALPSLSEDGVRDRGQADNKTDDGDDDGDDDNDGDDDSDHQAGDDGEQEDRFEDGGVIASSDHGGEGRGGEALDGRLGLTTSSDCEELKCLLCSESFAEADQLTVHMQAHSADMTHRCDVCRAAFLLPDVLRLHSKTHPHGRRRSRVNCAAAFPSISKRECRGRMGPSHAESELPAKEASKVEPEHSRSKAEKTHITEEEDGKKNSDQDALKPQLEEAGVYEGDTDVEPDPGPALRSSKHARQTTKTEHQPPSRQSFTCRENKKMKPGEGLLQQEQEQAPDADQWKKMEQQTDGDADVWCGCQHCGQSFRSLDALVTHSRSHYSRRPLHCKTCTKAFPSSGLLDAHRCRGAKRQTVLASQCEQCHVEFSTAAGLARHARTHAKKPRGCRSKKQPSKKVPSDRVCRPSHVCDVCSATCSTAQKLRQHKRAEHKEQRKFSCGLCGKELCNMQTLTAHERTHTGKNN